MSAPNPIFVSPSTTFVQVDPLQSPYNPVILNTVVFPGQTVTIRDATSSFGVLTTPIVISTFLNTVFSDGSISTLINQPQGFLTAQTFSTNAWTFLNSFPFRNQFVSAGVLNLTTSSLFTAVISSIQDFTGSLTVENLIVTGNFLQSQGITLNTNVSSLGTVEFISSLSVYDRAYFSSDTLVQGTLNLYSSLQVKDDFRIDTSLTTLSSLSISSLVSAMGSLSTPSIKLQDGLIGTRLEVQQSTFQTDVAGGVLITSNLSTLSSLNVGGFVQANSIEGFGDALFQSSASLFQTVSVSSFTSTQMEISTAGSLGVGGLLFIGNELFVQDNIGANGNGFIKDLFTIASTLVTSSLFTTTLETFGDFANNSTIALISSVTVGGNFGGMFVSTGSTVHLGLSLSTLSNLFVGGNLLVNTSGDVLTNISTFGSVLVRESLSIEGSFSNQQVLTVYSSLSTTGNLTVNLSTAVYQSSFINGNIEGLGNLFCEGTLTISSIVLPSSLLANNFTADSVLVGSKAYVLESILPSIKASSVTFGVIPTTEFPFDLSGSLVIPFNPPVSTLLLSTQLYNVCLFPINEPFLNPYDESINYNTTFLVPNGMGVGVDPEPSTLLVNPLAYFLSSMLFAFSTLSTGYVNANLLYATLIGDGSLISNIAYPQTVSTYEIFVSGALSTQALNISSMKVDDLYSRNTIVFLSTVTIGHFSMYGGTSNILNTIYQEIFSNQILIPICWL